MVTEVKTTKKQQNCGKSKRGYTEEESIIYKDNRVLRIIYKNKARNGFNSIPKNTFIQEKLLEQ